jgi:hypothetical protein
MSAARTPAPKHVDRDRRQTPGRIHPAAGDVFEAFTAGEKSLGCGIFEFPTFEFPLN